MVISLTSNTAAIREAALSDAQISALAGQVRDSLTEYADTVATSTSTSTHPYLVQRRQLQSRVEDLAVVALNGLPTTRIITVACACVVVDELINSGSVVKENA